MKHSSSLLAAGSLIVAAAPALAGTSFQVISAGIANGVSADGSVVVGSNNSGAFRWTVGGGFSYLGGASAVAASADGSIVGGNVLVNSIEQSARWVGDVGTPLGGILPTGCDFSLSSTYAISDDGSTMVGLGWVGCSGRAFRWTEAGGMTALPQLGSNSARANSISGDGTLIGGWDEGPNGQRRAAIWDANFNETLILTGTPGNIDGAGEVWGMNGDGSIFVGSASSVVPETSGPFIYREGKGVTYLGDIPETAPVVSGANDVSEDGSVVVGFQREGFGPFAIFDATIWTDATGTMRLSDYLTERGVTIPAGLQLASAMGVSADGTVIVGWGYSGFIFNQQAWVATLPATAPCVGDVDGDGSVGAADLATLLGAWGKCSGCAGDLDGDGAVGAADLAILLGAWGDCR